MPSFSMPSFSMPAFSVPAYSALRTRVLAPVVAATVAVTAVTAPAPSAHAFTVDIDPAGDVCTIEFTAKDKERVNGAYSGLFMRLATDAYGSFRGEQAKVDAKLVWDNAMSNNVKNISDWAIGTPLGAAQRRLATGEEKGTYWRMVGFYNAAQKEVIEDLTVSLDRREADEKGLMYNVDLASAAAGTIGGAIFGADTMDIRDGLINTLTNHAPEFAAPILSYNEAISSCAKGESKSSSVLSGSSMTTKQVAGLGIGGLIVGILSLIGLGMGLRPLVDQLLAQLKF